MASCPPVGVRPRPACAAEAVRAAASLSLGPPWSREGRGLRTSLRLARRGDGAVAVTQLSGNILCSVEVRDNGVVVGLAPRQRSATAPVLVRATRCDPHAL